MTQARRLPLHALVLPLAFFALAGAVSTSLPAAAEMPAKDEVKRASKLDAEGKKAYSGKDFLKALKSFQAAWTLSPDPRYAYNAARCLERLGRLDEAADWYRKYLEAAPDAPDRAEVETKMRVLAEQALAQKGLRQMRITSTPAGARLTIDRSGTPVVTPWEGTLAYGKHVLQLDLPGHDALERTIDVGPDSASAVEITLAATAKREQRPQIGPDLRASKPRGSAPVRGRGVRTAGIVSASIAGALVIAGTTLGLLARSQQATVDTMAANARSYDRSEYDAGVDTGRTYTRFANLALLGAAATGLTGALMWLLAPSDAQEAPAR